MHFPVTGTPRGLAAWPDEMWWQTSAQMAECLWGGAWTCATVCLSEKSVVVLYVLPPDPHPATPRFSPLLHLHLPVGECGVPHALPCVPTPWPALFHMANVNRCCTVTGSGRLLRGWWNRSCFTVWQRTVRRSQYSRKQQKQYACVCRGCWGLKRLCGPSLTPLSGFNSWLHQVRLYGSNLTDPAIPPRL